MERNQKIITLFNEGHNTVSIAKIMNISDSTVGRVLKKNGLKVRNNKIVISDKDIDKICNLYIQGLTTTEIQKIFQDKIESDNTIAKILRNNDIVIRQAQRRSVVGNHNIFSIIDTEQKAYFLGLLMADGCVRIPNNRPTPTITLELYDPDGYLVEKFKDFVEGSMKINRTKKSNGNYSTRVSFASKQIGEDLSKYGVIPNKTGKEYIPEIKDKLIPHFLRGVFDGDGTVYKTIMGGKEYLRFGFYGSHELCQQIIDYYGFQVSVFDKENVSFFLCTKKSDIEKFYSSIYTGATIYMTRKKAKFDEYLS